jgi:high affinity sulfate transporter 1
MTGWIVTLLPGLRGDVHPLARHNLVAGLTVTAYLVPQVMAYAIIAGLSPVQGLWAALVAAPLYALVGASRWLSFGPESSVAIMAAAVIVPVAATGQATPEAVAAALALAVGAVGLAASVLRLGFVADLLSRPILVGYMAGIAILIINSQLDKVLGVQTDGGSILAHLRQLGSASIHWPAVAVASVVLVTLVLLTRTRLKAFAPLLALVAGVAVGGLLHRAGQPPALLGDIPAGLPRPGLPVVPLDTVGPLLLAAVGVLLVAYADSTLTGRSFHRSDEPPLVATTELRALSLVNVAAGLFRGMPVSTSGSRSAVARAAGATDQGYSIATAGFLALVLLVAGPLLEVVPQAALGALVVYAAALLIDVAGFGRLWRFRRSEFALSLVTAAGVLVAGVLYGVLIAVGLSVLLLLVEVARPHSAALGFVPGLAGMHDLEDFPEVREEPGLLIFRYDSPLFFANAQNFLDHARAMIAARMPGLRWFALQCEAIIEVDSTGVDALQTLADELGRAGVRFVLVRAKSELQDTLRRTALFDRIGQEYVYPTLPTLVQAYRAHG